MSYACTVCGKIFERKTPYKLEEKVLCRGCKRVEFYKENPEKLEACMLSKKETFLRKYGVDNPSKNQEVQQKISKKIIEAFEDNKQGILDKRRKTSLRKYGVTSPSQLKDVQIKQRNTCIERYGYQGMENSIIAKERQEAAHSEAAYEKRHQTCQSKYGTDHHFQNKKVQDHQWDSYREKTGYDHPAKNPDTTHAYNCKGYTYNNVHFDSSWELAYYIWLTDHQKQFIYHPPYYIDYIDEGVERVYQPDFLVEGKFTEIKGDNFFDELGRPYNCYSKTFWWNKYEAMQKYGVIIMRFEEIKQYLRYVKETYGKDYLRGFKNKVQRLST